MRQYRGSDAESLALPPDIETDISAALSELAEFYNECDPSGFLKGTSDNPGYLQGTCDRWNVFVPWPLARYFPNQTVLREILELGERASLASVESVCVSGSVTSLGGGLPIGDMDFCQYVPMTPKEYVGDAERFIFPDEHRVLVTVRYGPDDPLAVYAPWADSWPTVRDRLDACASLNEAGRFMVEFIGQCPCFGVLPVSTVILSSDFSSRSLGAARFSFAYQEAITTRSQHGQTGAIWSLADPNQIGEYLCFLEDQIIDYADKKPIKALKRTFSLARIMGLENVADMALDILVRPELANYVTSDRQRDLRQMLARCSSIEITALRANFDIPFESAEDDETSLPSPISDGCNDVVGLLWTALNELDEELGEIT